MNKTKIPITTRRHFKNPRYSKNISSFNSKLKTKGSKYLNVLCPLCKNPTGKYMRKCKKSKIDEWKTMDSKTQIFFIPVKSAGGTTIYVIKKSISQQQASRISQNRVMVLFLKIQTDVIKCFLNVSFQNFWIKIENPNYTRIITYISKNI